MPDKQPLTTIDEYISTFPANTQTILQKVRQTIHQAAPDAVETISYGIPTFDLNGNHLISFAGWKRHLSLYPVPAGDAAFQQQIAPYKKGRGTLQFPFDKPIPYDLVEQVVIWLMREKPAKEKG